MGCRCSPDSNQLPENIKEKDLTSNLQINLNNSNNINNTPINNSYPPPDIQVNSSSQYPKTTPILKQDTFTNQNTKSTLPKSNNQIKQGNFKHYCQENNPYSSMNLTEAPSLKINSLNYALFNEINSIRANPKSYILKLAKYLNNIVVKDNKCLLNIGNEIYISLQSGYSAFEDAIAFLSSAKTLEPFEYVNELKIDFEIDEDKLTEPQGDSITSLDFIQNALTKKTNQLKGEYDIMGFHYDKSTDNAETSAVLQIVDDTGSNYVRRNNIMDNKVKYIGINSCCIRENVFCFYLVFANKKKCST